MVQSMSQDDILLSFHPRQCITPYPSTVFYNEIIQRLNCLLYTLCYNKEYETILLVKCLRVCLLPQMDVNKQSVVHEEVTILDAC